MPKFNQLINPLILNAGWVRFQGDSEFVDSNGKLQMGCWSFLDIIPADEVRKFEMQDEGWDLEDEIEESVLYSHTCYPIFDKAGNICLVGIHYGGDNNGKQN